MIDSMTRTRPAAAEQNADRRLGQHLLAVVRAQDAAIPAHRRAPRTVAEMRARLAQAAADDACGLCGYWRCRCGQARSTSTAPTSVPQAQQRCSACGGAGGRVVDTSSDGVIRQSWQTCGTCGGSGVSR